MLQVCRVLLSGSPGDEVPWQVLLILADGTKKIHRCKGTGKPKTQPMARVSPGWKENGVSITSLPTPLSSTRDGETELAGEGT